MYLPLPKSLTIKTSRIHGLGLFAVEVIGSGVILGVSHVSNDSFEDGWIRTPLGGFYNHSDTPNCHKELSPCGSLMFLVTDQNISPGEEITVKYSLYSVGKPPHNEPEEQ